LSQKKFFWKQHIPENIDEILEIISEPYEQEEVKDSRKAIEFFIQEILLD
jgi:hypothetical protein